jgi:hypothetical protein
MDLGYLKIKIDIKSEYDEFKKKYDYKRKETKKEEVKKIFEGFKDFFKSDGHFKFKENEHSLTAEYKDHGITLDVDIYKTIDSPDFDIEGTIKTFDRQCHEFVAEAVCNKDVTLQPAHIDEQERMIHDTRFFKDFLDGEVFYTYKFKIKGRDEVYSSMGEMMLAL